jgi:hypothetical protein
MVGAMTPPATALAQQCQATAGAVAPVIVELYTSEGCSSCPPADRWLSTLKGRPDVLPLAFHVTYWDKLGWPDRFATPEGTARQHELARDGAGVYTPQVRAAGRDWRAWPKLPAPAAAAAPVSLSLVREGDGVVARVGASAAGSALAGSLSGSLSGPFSGYWAVLEDGHQSAVKAGENAGENLRHDHVVRLYRPVPRWAAGAEQSFTLKVSKGDSAFPRRVAFVVVDASTQRPVQAVALAC